MPSHRILIPPGGGDQSRKGKKEFPSSEKLWVGGGGGGLSDRVLHARNAGTFFFSFLPFLLCQIFSPIARSRVYIQCCRTRSHCAVPYVYPLACYVRVCSVHITHSINHLECDNLRVYSMCVCVCVCVESRLFCSKRVIQSLTWF